MANKNVYKSPLAQSKALQTPYPYNKEKLGAYL